MKKKEKAMSSFAILQRFTSSTPHFTSVMNFSSSLSSSSSSSSYSSPDFSLINDNFIPNTAHMKPVMQVNTNPKKPTLNNGTSNSISKNFVANNNTHTQMYFCKQLLEKKNNNNKDRNICPTNKISNIIFDSCNEMKKNNMSNSNYVEIIENKLYWMSVCTALKSTDKIVAINIDDVFIYEPFYADFGPLNLAHVYRFCKLLQKELTDPKNEAKTIIHYCSTEESRRANACFLICAFQVCWLGRSADNTFKLFENVHPPFIPYRDATCGACTYSLTIYECIKGLEYAMKLGWFNLDTFDVEQYEYYERIENGDINWIIPNKFLAFSSPCNLRGDEGRFASLTAEDYVKIFKTLNVKVVVRLNRKQYDRNCFTNNGINHVDLYFLDGSCPSREIINSFLDISSKEEGALAVHCKAGLGRTGSLIGCYAIKYYRFPAKYWIGWNRICRPGSVLGPQQHFLNDIQDELFQMSIKENIPPPLLYDNLKCFVPLNILTLKSKQNNNTNDLKKTNNCTTFNGSSNSYNNSDNDVCYDYSLLFDNGPCKMSLEDERKAKSGEEGQGERLYKIKKLSPSFNTKRNRFFYQPITLYSSDSVVTTSTCSHSKSVNNILKNSSTSIAGVNSSISRSNEKYNNNYSNKNYAFNNIQLSYVRSYDSIVGKMMEYNSSSNLSDLINGMRDNNINNAVSENNNFSSMIDSSSSISSFLSKKLSSITLCDKHLLCPYPNENSSANLSEICRNGRDN